MELDMRFLLVILFSIGSTQALAIELDGRTEFAQELALNSSLSARVETIHVAVGQPVASGDLLLTLVSIGFQASADSARAEVNALAPSVAKMLTELEKAQELFDRDSLALIALQNAEQNHAIAEANLAAAAARLAGALFRLSGAEIRSPINGIVLDISTFPGQYINTRVSDNSLLTIADNSSMIVEALLPLEMRSDELLNRSAQLNFKKQIFKGKVIEIGRQVSIGNNNHPAVRLLVKFKTNGQMPAGLPVKIDIADK